MGCSQKRARVVGEYRVDSPVRYTKHAYVCFLLFLGIRLSWEVYQKEMCQNRSHAVASAIQIQAWCKAFRQSPSRNSWNENCGGWRKPEGFLPVWIPISSERETHTNTRYCMNNVTQSIDCQRSPRFLRVDFSETSVRKNEDYSYVESSRKRDGVSNGTQEVVHATYYHSWTKETSEDHGL